MEKILKFTEKDREEVLRLLSSKSIMGAKNYLNQLLVLKNYEEFYNEVKSVIRNAGKSNIISKDEIENLMEEYDGFSR